MQASFGVAQPFAQRGQAALQAAWFAAGALLSFLVPFVFTSAVDLRSDAYYAIYFASVAGFLAAYVRLTNFEVRRFATQHWRLSLLLGAAMAAVLVVLVLRREDSTPRPDGAYFAFTLVWRGVLYGAADALLLSAFPAAVAWVILERDLRGLGRKAAFAGLALGLTLVITAVYHLGYEQFREDGVGSPELGNTLISVPVLATANPLGSIIAHASMHVTADAHAYETGVFLPPQTDAD
jgi:hypothetical protein